MKKLIILLSMLILINCDNTVEPVSSNDDRGIVYITSDNELNGSNLVLYGNYGDTISVYLTSNGIREYSWMGGSIEYKISKHSVTGIFNPTSKKTYKFSKLGYMELN